MELPQDPEQLEQLFRGIPDWGHGAFMSRLVQSEGESSSWRLNMSVELSAEEGDVILGNLLSQALDDDDEWMGSDHGETFDFNNNSN